MDSYDKKSIKAVASSRAVARAFQIEVGYTFEEDKIRVGVCEEIIRLATLAAFGNTFVRGESDAFRRIEELARLFNELEHPCLSEHAPTEAESKKEAEEEEEVF